MNEKHVPVHLCFTWELVWNKDINEPSRSFTLVYDLYGQVIEFYLYFSCLGGRLLRFLIVKVQVSAFNKDKTQVGSFSVTEVGWQL